MPDRFHQLVVFKKPHIEGDHKHIFRTLPYIGDDFNDNTCSFAVLGGAWALYKDANFGTALGGVFAPRIRAYSQVEDYEVPQKTVSSVELVGDDARPIPHLILFEKEMFTGKHYHAFNDVYSLERYASFMVLSGNWQVRTVNNNTSVKGPGDGEDIDPADKFATMHLVSDTPNQAGVAHLIVFWDSNFEGNHRHVFQGTIFDDDWANQISSFAVEEGFWRFFFHRNGKLVSSQQMSRGIYPWVEDVEIDNDRTFSVSDDALQTAVTSLVVQNLNNGQDFLTFHGDPYRLGWNSHETILTPDNVRVPYFGKLWSHPFDPDERVYAQVLLASKVQGPAGAPPQDMLIAASAKNLVYSLNPADGSPIWQTGLFLPDGVTQAAFLNSSQFSSGLKGGCTDTYPNHGVNGTPVIDKVLQIIYVAFVAQVDDPANFNQGYFLSALALTTGVVLWTVALTWLGPQIPFQPYMHTQRAALALLKDPKGANPDVVLIGFSSRCDKHGQGKETWRGWLFTVPVSNGARPADGSWQALPMTMGNSIQDETGGGIWGPGGVAADDAQHLFLSTGNGTFNGNTAGGQDFADSVLSFDKNNIAFPPRDCYTPRNWPDLRQNDLDLGGSNPILLPAQFRAPAIVGLMNLAVCGGKDGRVYFVNTDDMGLNHFLNPVADGLGYSIWRPQIFSGDGDSSKGGITTSPAYFDAGSAGRYVYLCSPSWSPYRGLIAIKFDDLNGETQLGAQVVQFGGDQMSRPASPFVSSNGQADGIVWAVESRRDDTDSPTPSILHAWEAVSGRLLYSSPLTTEFGITGTGESLGDGRKFTPPVVVNGRVFLGTNGVVAYGLGTTDPA
jgi:hypothetical protein